MSEEEKYRHNCLVMEMANNWPWVLWMMDKYRNGRLQKADPMERDWMQFLGKAGIDVENYGKDWDRFLSENFR